MDQKTKIVQFRAPKKLSDVIDETATKNFQTRSEYIRRSIVERLRADGVILEALSTAQS
jgi:Arc/MetJ-type ribon-helix-helix transcriptional regulator